MEKNNENENENKNFLEKNNEENLITDSNEDSEENSNSEEIKICKKFNQIGKIPFGAKKKEIFSELLKTLNNTRSSIKIILFFCYENVKNAEMIISMIFEYFKNAQNFNKKVKIKYFYDLFKY